MKEDDRKQAELSGCAVVLHQTSSSPIRHREDEDEVTAQSLYYFFADC
jgi:hypothetical protein